MKAREFLAQRGVSLEERNLFRERLTAGEIKELGRRAGCVRELVAPTRRSEVEDMTDDDVVTYLADEPRRLRRPIIDTGEEILLGFGKAVQQRLG